MLVCCQMRYGESCKDRFEPMRKLVRGACALTVELEVSLVRDALLSGKLVDIRKLKRVA
jgi:hypothetical protein